MQRLTDSLRRSKKTVLVVTIVAALTILMTSLIAIWLNNSANLDIPSLGTISFEGVEGYWDMNLTNKTGADVPYNWGSIWPGATKNITLYLRSISNTETRFRLTETNWTFYSSSNKTVTGPSSSTPYMYLTWNYDNSTVQPGQAVEATLTLRVSSSFNFVEFLIDNDVNSFSFDIHISTSDRS